MIARPNPVLAQPPSGSAESSWSENTDSLLEKYAFHVGAGSEEDMSLQQCVGGQDWSRSPNLAVFDAVPQDQALSLCPWDCECGKHPHRSQKPLQ